MDAIYQPIKSSYEKGWSKFFKMADATKLDYPAEFFDYPYSIGSLEHFTDEGIDAVIDNLHYCTKIGSFHMMPLSKKNIDEGWWKRIRVFIIIVLIGGQKNLRESFQSLCLDYLGMILFLLKMVLCFK